MDFYCPRVKLAIEVDGDSHFTEEAIEYDMNRQKNIEEIGIRFLRFTNTDVKKNLYEVVDAIAEKLESLEKVKSG